MAFGEDSVVPSGPTPAKYSGLGDLRSEADLVRFLERQGFTKGRLQAAQLLGFSPEPWREVGATGQPAFLNSWSNQGGGEETVAFYKDAFGRVWLKGYATRATNGSGVPIFNLPVGYRPAKPQRLRCGVGLNPNEVVEFSVEAGGNVYPNTFQAPLACYMGSVSFRAA